MISDMNSENCESIRSRLLVAYGMLRAQCRPEDFDEAHFLDIIRQLQDYTDAVILSGEEPEGFYELRQGARRAVSTLLRRAPWLSETSKQIASNFRDAQPEFFDERYKFTENYSANYIELWPQLFSDYAGKGGLLFLEVGSFEGMSACWFLRNILTEPSSRLICIDQFLETNEADNSALFDTYVDSEGRAVFERFIYNIRLTGRSNQVTVLRDSSHVSLRTIPRDCLDVAYIDGSHQAADVLQDAILAWGALKPNGLLIFDDYDWQPPLDVNPLHSPKPAIDALLEIFATQIAILHFGTQVVVRKVP